GAVLVARVHTVLRIGEQIELPVVRLVGVAGTDVRCLLVGADLVTGAVRKVEVRRVVRGCRRRDDEREEQQEQKRKLAQGSPPVSRSPAACSAAADAATVRPPS